MLAMKTFAETSCTFSHESREVTSGGSWIGRHRKTGKLVGLLYVYPNEGKIGTWQGDKKVPVRFGREWRSNMGDTRQGVWFTWDGVQFSGIYYKSGSDIARVKEVGEPHD